MQYWDDGSGFHVSGNALPNGYPAYTPEVAAARAQHLRLYQAALEAAGHGAPPPVRFVIRFSSVFLLSEVLLSSYIS